MWSSNHKWKPGVGLQSSSHRYRPALVVDSQSSLNQTRGGCIRSVCFVAMVMLFAFVVVMATPFTAGAADEVVTFDNPDHKQMYQVLLREYRCLKCQNQNLWDSNASLAGDLRREIRDQIIDGKSKADIDEYLVSRYGEFVLYRPRLTAKTAILWIGPFVLLLIGLASLVVMVRNKSNSAVRQAPREPSTAAQQHAADKLAKARKLLDD